MKKISLNELGRISVNQFKESEKTPITIVLDNIRSLHNVGSIFRTSDAFRVEKIFLCGITATPPNREIQKTALGSTESVDWEYCKTTIMAVEKLIENNYEIVAIEQTTQSIDLAKFEIDAKKKYALVFGNEVNGVDDEVLTKCNKSVEIPQFGTKHSFNVSVTAGIVLYALFSKMK